MTNGENKTANQLVKMAETYFKRNSEDRKYFVWSNEFITLIDARREVDPGYNPEKLNSRQIGGNYLHKVIYEGREFVSVTEEPLNLES